MFPSWATETTVTFPPSAYVALDGDDQLSNGTQQNAARHARDNTMPSLVIINTKLHNSAELLADVIDLLCYQLHTLTLSVCTQERRNIGLVVAEIRLHEGEAIGAVAHALTKEHAKAKI
jgi:hypothetical protein